MELLLVRCKTGCGWKGKLRSLEDHMQNKCGNILVPCPNGCNNGLTRIIRKQINFHLSYKCPNRSFSCTKCQKEMEFRNAKSHELNECPERQYTCPHCNEAGAYDERTTTHLEVCPKVEITCKNCSLQIFRFDKSRHFLDCPNEPVRCTYYNIGCEETPLRRDLTKHEENAQMHLTLATNKILKLTNMLLVKNTLTFKVSGFQKKKKTNFQFVSPAFRTSESGYNMYICLYANGYDEAKGTHITVFAHLMKGDNDDSLSWPFTGTVTIELLNQLEDDNHCKKTLTYLADSKGSQRVVNGERGRGWGYHDFISHTDLDYMFLTNTQYLKDDTLIFRVSAEAPDYKPWLECTNCV